MRSQRRIVWQLADQLRTEVARLIERSSLDGSSTVRRQIEDAAGAVCRHIGDAFMTERDGDFGRLVRLARSALHDVQDGCRAAVRKQLLTERDIREARELLSQLYPALSSLLAQSRR